MTTSIVEHCTRLSLSQRDHSPLDLQGPVLSVETIVAIVIAILLTVATIIVILYFVRCRSRGSNPNLDPVAGTHNVRTVQHPDIELTSQPPQRIIHPPARAPTYDQGVPAYEPDTLPRYCEKQPQAPSLNPSSSSRSS